MPRKAKPADQRQNRGKREIGLLSGDRVPNPPRPPKGLKLAGSRKRWAEFWGSPLAWTIRQDIDLDVLERLFLLKDRYARYDAQTAGDPMLKGSADQQVVNPLIRTMTALATEIRQLEDRLGFHAQARKDLGIHMPEPQNAHEAPAADDPHSGTAVVTEDPRLTLLQGSG